MNVPDQAGAGTEIARLERRLRREVAARHEAEAIAERGLRDLFQRQQEMALLESIAVAANETDDVNDAMARALESVCRYTHWPLGHVWLVSVQSGMTRFDSTGIWYDEATLRDDADPVRTLRTQTEAGSHAAGVGIPGAVVRRRAPVWIEVAAPAAAEIPRLQLIVDAGFASLFAFPVMIASEVVAVLEFFSREQVAPEDPLLRLLAQIGTQLGRVVERRRAQDKLLHDALHDPLTQLGNRKLFLDRLTHLLQRAQRGADDHFAVLFVDLDRFKSINDGLGHQAGDQLIIASARRLSACLRQNDLVVRDRMLARHEVARLGGDEFVILLDQIEAAESAIVVAERLMGVLAEPFDVADQRVFVTASVGIALSASGYADVEDILRDADIAMYHAKQTGRARWVMFDQAMQQAAVRRLRLEADLHDALAQQQFFLHFQPIVAPGDGRVLGFEALLRWRHPVHGIVSPGEFIPVIEETGMIEPIGAWVLDTACNQLREWQYAYGMDLSMSVNVSAVQFAGCGLVDVVKRALVETAIAPSSLKLELTESAVMADAEHALAVFAELKALGVRVSLDDFGTGYSSLSYLRRLPIDTLKIDRSFVSKLDCFDDKRQIVEVVLMLARALGLDVVAEGVETEAELRLLRDMGCNLVQGYYYFHPLTPADATQVLAAQAAVAMC